EGAGADHSNGVVNNLEGGVISSDSRALNIDGIGLTVNNAGEILGTGDQRNGTVYADGTADDYSFTNTDTGVIDAGAGNNGSAVSLQTGDVNGDTVSASVVNDGVFQGRGDAEIGNTIGDGLRVFSSVENASFDGDIENNGLIAGSEESDVAAGIRVDGGVTVLGTITNNGEVTGSVTAIDATEGGPITFVNGSEGVVNGDIRLGAGTDSLTNEGTINGVIDGGDGNDDIDAGDGDNVIIGGLGNDSLTGGDGADVFEFAAGEGLDVVRDFELGVDRLDLSDLGPDFDVQANTVQDGDDAVISFGDGNAVRLENVDASLLDDDDFLV
ncbi:MAG: calcium-binding protein, partial [Pseudomonadota bacterium]